MLKTLFILSLVILFIPCIGIAECEYVVLHAYDISVLEEKIKEYLKIENLYKDAIQSIEESNKNIHLRQKDIFEIFPM